MTNLTRLAMILATGDGPSLERAGRPTAMPRGLSSGKAGVGIRTQTEWNP